MEGPLSCLCSIIDLICHKRHSNMFCKIYCKKKEGCKTEVATGFPFHGTHREPLPHFCQPTAFLVGVASYKHYTCHV